MTLLLRHDDVAPIATMDVAIAAMSDVFRLEGEGRVGQPRRHDVASERGWLRLMPVVAAGLNAFGFKAMNLTKGVGVRYAIWVYDLESGALRGILDAKLITAIRTAATSAVATDRLARTDVDRTAVIGTGAEARTHLRAMQAVRPAAKVTVYSRSAANRAAFVDQLSPLVDAELVNCSSLADAVTGAGLVVLATKSPAPVLHARHLQPGMHVNSIGSARKDQFELATDTFDRFATVVCDSREHVFSEAGDAIDAVAVGAYEVESAVNLADLVVRGGPGRRAADEITLYKSVGTATQDIALASKLLDIAEAEGIGTDIGRFPEPKSFE